MSRDCEKCALKHKGKTQECNYKEVLKFVEIININHNTKYELIDCPDEDDDSIYTVDLEYEDKSSNKKLYIEVKEAIIGFSQEDHIGEETGQRQIGSCISEAIDALSIEKQNFLTDYVFIVPHEQLGNKDYELFIDKMYRFLDENIINGKIIEDKFYFVRSYQNKKVEIEIFRKDDSFRNICKETIFQYNTKGQSFEEIFKMITDNDTLIEKIDDNFLKTEKSKNKFPNDGQRKILLQILRLPFGMETFYNFALIKWPCYIAEYLRNKSYEYHQKYSSVDESYLVYYFDDFYKNVENVSSEKPANALLCVPIIGGLIKEPNVFLTDEL